MVHPLITLFPSTATTFTTNGLGSLAEAESCVVTEEANGEFELEMVYPTSGRRFNDLTNRAIIFVKPNPYGNPQPFRIYKISKPMNGMVTYYASHISYDLSGIPVDPFEANSCSEAIAGLKTHSLVTNPFTFTTDIQQSGYFWPAVPKSARSLLGSDEGIASIYGGDLEFDGFNVRLLKSRGKESGVSIRYGKNLTDISQEEDGSTAYSGILPYWEDSSTEELVMLSGNKIVATPGTHNYTNVLAVDLTSEFDGAPNDAELRAAAEKYIADNGLGVPAVNIDVSFTQLEQTEEYKDYALLEKVELFDTVTVVYPKLEISATARVITTVYDAIRDRYESVTLGDAKATLSDTIASQDGAAEEAVNKAVSDMAGAINNATKWITNGKGYMVAIRDSGGNWYELVSLDTPDITTAKQVWRWNNGGFGHSSTGYGGPYTTAITQDGKIVANFIQTGTMSADRVRGGSLIAGGAGGQNGVIQVLDSGGTQIGRWDSSGLVLNRGVLQTSDYVANNIYTRSGWIFNLTNQTFKSPHFSFGVPSQNVTANVIFDAAWVMNNTFTTGEYAMTFQPAGIRFLESTSNSSNWLAHTVFGQQDVSHLVGDSNYRDVGINTGRAFELAYYANGNYNQRYTGYLFAPTASASSSYVNGMHRFWGSVALQSGCNLMMWHSDNDGGTTGSAAIAWHGNGDVLTSSTDYYIRTYNELVISGTSFFAYGNLGCSGNKSRLVDTQNYGITQLYSYETATPYFSDLGCGTVSEDGQITIMFDDKFAETVDMRCEYQVFLTQTSPKATSWVDKQPGYFVVHGEPGATFDWMVSVPQRDYSSTRMENTMSEFPKPEVGFDESIFYKDGAGLEILENDLEQYEKEIDLL